MDEGYAVPLLVCMMVMLSDLAGSMYYSTFGHLAPK